MSVAHTAASSSSGSRHKCMKGTMLLDATLRDFIVRSPLWKYHVANSSLRWIVAKLSHADGISPSLNNSNNATTAHSVMGSGEQQQRFITADSGRVDAHGNPLGGGGASGEGAESLASYLASSALSGAKRGRHGEAAEGDSTAAQQHGYSSATSSDDSSSSDDEAGDGISSGRNGGHGSRPNVYVTNATEQFMAELDGVDYTYAPSAPSSAAAANAGGASAAAAKQQKEAEKLARQQQKASAAASTMARKSNADLVAELYAAPSTSAAGTEVDKPVYKRPHVLFMATFHETASAAAAMGLSTGNVYKTSELLSGAVRLRPELFVCLLLRALQLGPELHSLHIVEMVEQTNSPNTITVPSSASGEQPTKTVIHNLNGSKYLRVFGLFLARMLLAYRGETLLLRRCYEASKTDFRRVRVMRHRPKKEEGSAGADGASAAAAAFAAGGDEENPVAVMRVDEVAHALMTSDRWDRIAFPVCKAL